MEKSVEKSSNNYDLNDKNFYRIDNKTSTTKRKTIKSFETQKEINSWDCSSSSENVRTLKNMVNDWDSNSDFQETMVEAFDVNENFNSDGWDSECEKIECKNDQKNQKQSMATNSLDSFYFTNSIFKDKSSPSSSQKEKESFKDDCLIVEDFEEHMNDPPNKISPSVTSSLASLNSLSEKVRSKQSEGTPEDTTIWMIPKSERTDSGEPTSSQISSSGRENIENLNRFRDFFKKTKSLSDMQKSNIGRSTARSSRSENLGSQKNNYNSFLLCEGSNLERKLEIESKDSKENNLGCEKFHRTRVFFTEYDSKSMALGKDVAEKQPPESSTTDNTNEDMLPENEAVSDEKLPKPVSATGEENNKPESSDNVPNDVTPVDSDDSLGKRQNGDFHLMGLKMKQSQTTKSYNTTYDMKVGMSESWLLFDDAGKYQQISKNEVSMLFNGRSAEAVLQGRTEHLVPTSSLRNTNSLKNLLSNFEPKESLAYVLKEEDTGGDDEFKRLIDLERKVENTLFYIRPDTDLRASIRIIPVNAEMIHIWKRNRDSGNSNISLDPDQFSLLQDLADTNYLNQYPNLINQPQDENPMENENQSQTPETPVQPSGTISEFQTNQSLEFSKLLIETRNIVDTLTNNFKILQSRLDGETNRNTALQVELSKLRLLLKNYPEHESIKNFEASSIRPCINPSLLTLKPSDKVDIRSESIIEEETEDLINAEVKNKSVSVGSTTLPKSQDGTISEDDNTAGSNVITVNIYTVEDPPTSSSDNQENNPLSHSSLKLLEKKMKRLQQENLYITKQNMELKRKLKEISLELEKCLPSCSDQDFMTGTDEGKELIVLREEMDNLQQELESVKTVAKDQEVTLTEENILIREEFLKSLTSLNEWSNMAGEIFRKIQNDKNKLVEIGIDINIEEESFENPKKFKSFLSVYLENTCQLLHSVKNENFIYEKVLKDVQKETNNAKEMYNLEQVISGYSELIEQCRKGQVNGETKNKVMDDYFAVIMEKASLMEEVKILKTENEMLLESQLEHYEKLKQTMIALKDRKSEIIALESSQKLSEDENTRMAEVLKLFEEEKKQVEVELTEKNKIVEDLTRKLREKELEICDFNEKLNTAMSEVNNFEKIINLKDEMINKLKIEKEELLNSDGIKNEQIEILREDIKNLEMQCSQLEAEVNSTKLFLNDSHKEMTDYITHLETLVSNSQETLEKTKQKLKESNQSVNRLKNENEVLEKQHQCDTKLFNNTKEELESCKEKLIKINKKLKESEEEQERLNKKCETLIGSEKEKSEAFDSLVKEYKMAVAENEDLKEKIKIYTKDREELLSEQKDLICKYGVLSKEIQKLQEKYRSVKTECNERTDLIRYLEMMLRENLIEYNNRIACLEQNISQIIEKIILYKNGMRGKHTGDDSEVKELRHQLNITCQERKELENVVDNYYALMKHLENEIKEREKKMDELHVRLSLQQQKNVECVSERSLEETKVGDALKMEKLQNDIAVAENELGECKRELQRNQTNHENEKKKLELTIADLKSEVKRYQLRIEVMMRNLSNSNKNINSPSMDKRNGDDSSLQGIKKEIEEKEKIISELNDAINKYKAELKLKEGDLENLRKKNFYQNEELKNLQNQIAKFQNDNLNKFQQKEKNEMAEKLFQSIKLIMEERSARQTIESLALEKENNYKHHIDQIKNELVFKIKECETLSVTLEDKKKLINKLQYDLKKMKVEIVTLKGQLSSYKKRETKQAEEQPVYTASSTTQIKSPNISQERLESCLKELKEIRDLNLELRKTEGQYKAKIVKLEDEIRDARLLIKELQGDIKTEKKSKKAFKNMIIGAKMEIEKCVMAKQLMSVIGEKISRHLDLSEISSRELLSGFRLSDSSSSLKMCTSIA